MSLRQHVKITPRVGRAIAFERTVMFLRRSRGNFPSLPGLPRQSRATDCCLCGLLDARIKPVPAKAGIRA